MNNKNEISEERRKSIISFIKEFISNYFETVTSEIEEDSGFDEFQMDSLDNLEMVISLEEEYGIEISDQELTSINKIKDIIDIVERKIDELL